MKTNLLKALINLITNPIVSLENISTSSNRMNSQGESFEIYIKNAFCDSFVLKESLRLKAFEDCFSYLGNTNNPPDFVIKQGDAVEVKKINTSAAQLSLNSSYPKDRLYSGNPMLTTSCRKCEGEDWTEKDLIYCVGHLNDSCLKSVWFVYGDCFCANSSVYEKIKGRISNGLNDLPDIQLSTTKELARVNRVDPLGITYLRVRGMWGIENPSKVFSYLLELDDHDNHFAKYEIYSLMLEEKYQSFPLEDREELEGLVSDKVCSLREVKIKSPNNPAKLLDARIFAFVR